MAEVQIQSISHRHEAIADFLLAHPDVKSLDVLCERLNVSRPWLSVVMNSDVFREYFAKRRQEWQRDQTESIGNKQLHVMGKAWDKLSSIIDSDDTDPRLVFDVASKTAERLFGKSAVTTVKEERIQEVSRPVDAGTLAQAREVFRRSVTTVKEVPLEQLPAP